jgi:hypothetical protein
MLISLGVRVKYWFFIRKRNRDVFDFLMFIVDKGFRDGKQVIVNIPVAIVRKHNVDLDFGIIGSTDDHPDSFRARASRYTFRGHPATISILDMRSCGLRKDVTYVPSRCI